MLAYNKQKHLDHLKERISLMSISAGLDYDYIDINNYKEIRDNLNLMLVPPELFRKKVELRAIMYSYFLANGEVNNGWQY